jgi:hypothetical protein
MLKSANLSDVSATDHKTVVEAALAARVADMSVDQRNQVTNRAIDILRTNNAGSEAEMEVRRIMGA